MTSEFFAPRAKLSEPGMMGGPPLADASYRRTIRSPRSLARQLPSPSCEVSASTTSPRAYFSISERFTRKPVMRTRSEADE